MKADGILFRQRLALAKIFFLLGLLGVLWTGFAVAEILNDIHSQLNATNVDEVLYPENAEDVVLIIKKAKEEQRPISISGGRHAMGGQQFGEGTIHLSMKRMKDVLAFDRQRGIVSVESGIEWPDLMQYLERAQKDTDEAWGIVQKQTGADNLSLGGALSANIHGRGARLKPIVQDIESFMLATADGKLLKVSRAENAELFRLVIGGYGLFGVITSVDLRLMKRVKLERVVEVVGLDELQEKVTERLSNGFMYGDFQYKTDDRAADFMRIGVFSAYRPLPKDAQMPDVKRKLSGDDWRRYLLLAHTDKARAFEFYSQYYLSTHLNRYWSDSHQTGFYDDHYLDFLNEALPKDFPKGSLMITEVYVPRASLEEFINDVSMRALRDNFNIIYGTVRLIERDDETFLAWAKENYACIIFNLRVDHSQAGLDKAKKNFRQIISAALDLGGSYFLTYHRWAEKEQVLKAYPQFPEFLRLKLKYDPEERFQSEWYRHYKVMFA